MQGSAEGILALLREWEAAADEPPPLVIATSGSTGRPKGVVLSRAAMRASAYATAERLGGHGQWVLNLPPTYVAGVQVLFRSVLAGTEPILGDWRGLEPTAGRRFLSLVPTQLVRATTDGSDVRDLSRFDAVLVGGGPLDPAERAEAESMGIPIVQTYGMSETCGGCVYDGHPLDGVGLKVDDQDQIWLTGPMLFDGYADDPERTAEVLHDGWFRTDDLGRLDEDGRLRVLGRADDVIISGGVKVPPHAVEQMLRNHPDVVDVCVVGRRDPEWGEVVVAVVDGGAPPAELRDLVEPRAWAPREVVHVPGLPLLANGKIDRLAVRELAR